jgi:hypothetical protein
MTDGLIYVRLYIGMATAPEAAAPCPSCRSSHTRKLTMLSEQDPGFDFFMCGSCGHAWKVPKHESATDQRPVMDTHSHPYEGKVEQCTYPGCTKIARLSREAADDRPRRRKSDSLAPSPGGLVAAWRCPLGHVVPVEE